jgi:hypothetical protein
MSKNFISFTKCPDLLWGEPSFLFDGYLGLFKWLKQWVSETYHSLPVLRLRMSGTIPPSVPKENFIFSLLPDTKFNLNVYIVVCEMCACTLTGIVSQL